MKTKEEIQREIDEEWNKYFIPGTTVLKNKLGIEDEDLLREKEIEITLQKSLDLYDNPIQGNFDKEHLKNIHKYIFDDVYPFAGEYRTVYMQKNNSYFAPVNDIDYRLDYTFDLMEKEFRDVTDKYAFASFLTTYYIELLYIHPFREGNGRSIREFIREYANEKSKLLRFGPIEFHWNNVDEDEIHLYIDKSLAFRSNIELEFLKAIDNVSVKNNLK